MVEKDRVKIGENTQAFDSPPLQQDQKVYCQDGYAGKVISLRLNSEKKYQSFVVQTGLFFQHRYIVPSEWIDRIESDRVYLSAKKEDLKSLPKERPDPILVIEMERALRAEGILHGAEIKDIRVGARRGFITLNGYVPNAAQKTRAEQAARQIPGVLEVENRLVVDEDLTLAAAEAVAQIPDSSAGRIFVGAQNGYIVLTGEVPSDESRVASEERAGSVPEIRGVLNWIRVDGLKYSEPRALQPRIGARVLGRNIVSSHVEQVIVNRVNRLVEAIVVDGLCPEPRKEKTHWFVADVALVRRKVVIPVHTIQHHTKNAVFLEKEAPQFEDFNPESVTRPDATWHPPYPYHRNHVLLYHPIEAEQVISKIAGVNQIGNAVE
jgi:osmotically-inducible protein OsmY